MATINYFIFLDFEGRGIQVSPQKSMGEPMVANITIF
jgi:hypothetical protein